MPEISRQLFDRARRVFPDGTTRITVERNPAPIYAARGEGAWLFDVEGRRRLDLHGNFTVLIHGHAFPPVVEAVSKQLRAGTCFANPTAAEVALAEVLTARVPGVEHVRFVNTGTEAVMFAVKAARAFTGRPAIAKVEGAYHGAYDWIEVSQTSTPANWGTPETPASTPYYKGMPASVLDEVVVFRWNDAVGAAEAIARNAHRLAAVVLDPMPSRIGLIPPAPGFLAAVAEAARQHGVLVIADEVLNFRLGYEGASARFGLAPDIFTFGKIVGGGFPIGAVGGRADVMAVFGKSTAGALVPQGGTFSANPVSMVAGLASLEHLTPEAFDRLEALGTRLRGRLEAAIEAQGLAFCVTGAGSLLRLHARATPPRDFRDAVEPGDTLGRIPRLLAHFEQAGLLVSSSGMLVLSTAMTDDDIDLVADAFDAFAATEARAPVGA